MFKSVRWKSERNKIKAEFKLKFHATQVSQLGMDALALSVVPGDVGKPTVRLEKATVRDGSCRWENQVLITVKFLKEPKSGKINEKIYYFLVSSGSSNLCVLGEVSIDLAEYAETTKPSSVTLPLKSSTSNAVLHVSIQRMQANTEQREEEESEDTSIKSQDKSLKTYLSHSDTDESGTSNSHNKDSSVGITPKTFEISGYRRGSSGSDITLSSSESSSGLDTPRELGMRNNNTDQDQDHTSCPSTLSHSSVPNRSIDHVSGNSFSGNKKSQPERSSLGSHDGSSTEELSDNSLHVELVQQATVIDIEKLKAEMIVVARRADVSELELHTLRKHIIKESKKGQDLTGEIVSLKEERNALKAECERLKAFQLQVESSTRFGNKLRLEGGGDIQPLLEETKQELKDEKDLNRDLQFKLQKMEESRNELILTIKGLEERLNLKNDETSDLSNKSKENAEEDEEQKELEYLVKQHINADETYRLEQKVIDLCGEIEIYRRDKDELEMQMEQLALDYEILKQENHDILYKLEQSNLQEQLKMQYECSYSSANVNELETQIENLEKELKQQARDFSDSLANMKELESHITMLEEEIEKQTQSFESELEAVMGAKVEQEQRAIRAEEALRKTKQENANIAERLQKEFRSISKQMIYAFVRNEKMAAEALAEARDLHVQRIQLEGTIQKAKDELQSVMDDYEARISELLKQVGVRTSQFEATLLEVDVKSREIQILKSKIERLATENHVLSHKVDHAKDLKLNIEQLKTSAKEVEMLIQKGDVERNDLVNGGRCEVTPNGGLTEETTILPEEQWNDGSTKRKEEISSKKEPKPIDDNEDHSSDRLLTEFESLRERNISMEVELKEMQERYSEISLKFAEVEGERQKLVMSLRSIKNSRK